MAQEELDRTEWVQRRFEGYAEDTPQAIASTHEYEFEIKTSNLIGDDTGIEGTLRLSRLEMTTNIGGMFVGNAGFLDLGSLDDFSGYIVEDSLVVGCFEDPIIEFAPGENPTISFETIRDVEVEETSKVTIAAVVHEHRG